MSEILESATQLMVWVVSNMATVLNFITANPVILVLFLMMLVSFVVGILFRIWRSTGV